MAGHGFLAAELTDELLLTYIVHNTMHFCRPIVCKKHIGQKIVDARLGCFICSEFLRRIVFAWLLHVMLTYVVDF